MIRTSALTLLVTALTIYAWKDWFKSLCGLIFLMSVFKHEDMPRQLLGITGLNPWNVLLASVLLAWLASRHRERSRWDLPRHLNVLLLIYLALILVGALRTIADRGRLGSGYTVGYMFGEFVLNTLKWVVPGLLVFWGCRTRRRWLFAVGCLLAFHLLLAMIVARRIPPRSAIGSGVSQRTRLGACSDAGYSACDMSAILAGASWACVACLPICRRRRQKAVLLAAAAVICYGQALTGGRAGWVAWAAIGLILCFLRWRKHVALAPAVLLLLALVFPGAAKRAAYGLDQKDATGQAVFHESVVTSGRTKIWHHVLEKIAQSPVVGYGRFAYVSTGLRDHIGAVEGRTSGAPGHPHNMYLEWLLDNGILGLIPVLLFYGTVAVYAARLFRDRADPWCRASGGIALAFVFAQLVTGLSAQHLHPRESTLGMWVAIFLMLRVHVERSRARAGTRAQSGIALYPSLASRPKPATGAGYVA